MEVFGFLGLYEPANALDEVESPNRWAKIQVKLKI